MHDPDRASIACTLSTNDLRTRLDRIRLLTHGGLLSHRLKASTLRLLYRAQFRDELLEIIAAERICCAFLRFDLHDTADGLELLIESPAGTDVEARWLFDQFLPEIATSARKPTCDCDCECRTCRQS